MRPFSLSKVGFVFGFSVLGCIVEHPDAGDVEGAGGTAAGAGGSSGDDTGSGGSGAQDTCAQAGAGRIEVGVSGLPEGIEASILLTGPLGSRAFAASEVIEGAPGGPYQILVSRVTEPDPIVRSVYEYRGSAAELCLGNGGILSVSVDYERIPTSQRLWTNNSNGAGDLLGFSGDSLGATANAEPDVSAVAGAGKDVTFDADGNLWTMGATLAEPHLMRFPRYALGSSGEKAPDRSIDIAGVECLPAMRAFAFDREAALWVSTCGGRIVKLGAAELEAAGEVTPAVALSGLGDNGDVAFDIDGNLWVTDGDRIARYDAARLAASSDAAGDLLLAVQSSGDGPALSPTNLAFDGSGNLWVIDFGGNLLSKVPLTDLTGTGEVDVVAQTTLALSVSALLERPAFDESRRALAGARTEPVRPALARAARSEHDGGSTHLARDDHHEPEHGQRQPHGILPCSRRLAALSPLALSAPPRTGSGRTAPAAH